MLASGWLGRYVQTLDSPAALAAVAVDSALPRSMSGSSLPLAMASLDSFRLELDETAQAALQSVYEMDSVLGPTAQSVFDAAHIIEPLAELPAGAGYPAGDLGMALADTGRLIRGGTGLTVAAVNSGGWDHHDDQAARIEPLLTELATALLAFREDIDEFWTDTTVLVHTEFGRRAAENASGGTDHGHGSLMLVAGGGIRGGQVFGEWPGLGPDELSAGEDLAVTTDYRQVLAEILVNHMGLADPVDVFGDWQPGAWLGLFAGAGASDATAGRAVRLARRPDQSHHLAHVQVLRPLLDLRHELALLLPGRAEQLIEGGLEQCGTHLPTAGIVASGHMAQGIGRGEGKRHAGSRTTKPANAPAAGRAEQPADQLAAELLEILRGHADSEGRQKLLDVATVKLDAIFPADRVDHANLQRDDRHRGP